MIIARHAWASPSLDATSHTVGLPAEIEAGDLLVCLYASDGGTTCTPSLGWATVSNVSNGTAVTGAVFYKLAEGNDALTVSTGAASQMASAVTYVFRGQDYVDATSSISAAANTATPQFFATSLNRIYTYVAALFVDATGVASSPPPSFSELTTSQHASAGGASVSSAERTSSDAVTAVESWTIVSTAAKVSSIIAVYIVPKLRGVVKDTLGQPSSKAVSAYRRDNGTLPLLSGGRLAGQLMSDPIDGGYSIQCPDNSVEYFLVALDDGDLPPLIIDRKTPT